MTSQPTGSKTTGSKTTILYIYILGGGGGGVITLAHALKLFNIYVYIKADMAECVTFIL